MTLWRRDYTDISEGAETPKTWCVVTDKVMREVVVVLEKVRNPRRPSSPGGDPPGGGGGDRSRCS